MEAWERLQFQRANDHIPRVAYVQTLQKNDTEQNCTNHRTGFVDISSAKDTVNRILTAQYHKYIFQVESTIEEALGELTETKSACQF